MDTLLEQSQLSGPLQGRELTGRAPKFFGSIFRSWSKIEHSDQLEVTYDRMQTWIWEFEVKIPVPYYISSGRFWGEYEFSLYSTLDSSDSKRRHLRLKPVSFGEGFSVCDLK